MNITSWRWSPFFSTSAADKPKTSTESLRSLYGDEELSDIKIQGSDGGIIVAVKAILSVRSPVFRNLFYRPLNSTEIILSEGKDLIIFKEWDCCTLNLLVEFCYTDNVSAMEVKPSDYIVRVMVNLKAASKFFKLQALHDKVEKWSSKQVRLFPALACALIDEVMKRNDIEKISLNDIDKKSLEIIQSKPKAALLPQSGAIGDGVLSLTEPALLFVLRTIEGLVSQHLIVDVIKRWDESSKNDRRENIKYKESSRRQEFARKCSIRFVNIPDSDRFLSKQSTVSSLGSPYSF